MPFDLFCYRLLTWAFDKVFDLPLYWTVDNICESVTREADFRSEAAFTKQAKVAFPAHRLLSMALLHRSPLALAESRGLAAL
jgi:aarF domain-containing kinase